MAIHLSVLSACWTVLLLAKVHSELSAPVYEKLVPDGKTATISCASLNNSLTLEIIDGIYDESKLSSTLYCGEHSARYPFKGECDGKTTCTIWAMDPCRSPRPLKVRYTCAVAKSTKENAPAETKQWRQYQAAEECEKTIMSQPHPNDGKLYCSRTFDSWGCWNDTLAGTQARIQCPVWVNDGFDANLFAFKDCSADGTWAKHPDSGKSWSNYTTCFNLDATRLPA